MDENDDCVFNRIVVNSTPNDPVRVMAERLMDDMHIHTHRDKLKVLSSNSEIFWMKNRNLLYLCTTLFINKLIKK